MCDRTNLSTEDSSRCCTLHADSSPPFRPPHREQKNPASTKPAIVCSTQVVFTNTHIHNLHHPPHHLQPQQCGPPPHPPPPPPSGPSPPPPPPRPQRPSSHPASSRPRWSKPCRKATRSGRCRKAITELGCWMC